MVTPSVAPDVTSQVHSSTMQPDEPAAGPSSTSRRDTRTAAGRQQKLCVCHRSYFSTSTHAHILGRPAPVARTTLLTVDLRSFHPSQPLPTSSSCTSRHCGSQAKFHGSPCTYCLYTCLMQRRPKGAASPLLPSSLVVVDCQYFCGVHLP